MNERLLLKKLLALLKKLIQYEDARVCKHAIALDIIDEFYDSLIDLELISSISNCDDDAILRRIKELKKIYIK